MCRPKKSLLFDRRALSQLSVYKEETLSSIAGEFQALNDLFSGFFFLDLLVNKPME